jgi:CheY-like chemotaxis protein
LIASHTQREGSATLRVLLAEDNRVNQRVATRLLEKRGYTVVVAEDGARALEALQEQSFDLILMDVQMPVLDGVRAAMAIREQEKTTGSHIPIIAMTAHAMAGDRERFLESGMDGYISKPFNSQELFQVIETFVGPNPQPGLKESNDEERPPEMAAPAVNGNPLSTAMTLWQRGK